MAVPSHDPRDFIHFVGKRTNTQTQTQTNKTLTQAAPPNLERLGSSDKLSSLSSEIWVLVRHNHSNHIRLAHQVVVNIGDRKTFENMGSTIAGKNRAKMAESLWRDTHCKFCKMQFRFAFCLEKRVKCDLAPFLKTS